MGIIDWLRSQFTTLPVPDQDCTGKTFIVTGANTGLGLEAARHLVRLNAARVIIACRNVEKGEAAKKDIEATTARKDVLQVWSLDLTSFDSIREFVARVEAELDRIDVLVNNASVFLMKFRKVDEHEEQFLVNVMSTLYFTILMLPVLRKSGLMHNMTPKVTIVSSDAALMADFPERKKDNIISALDAKMAPDRYSLTKLLQLMVLKKLASDINASGKGHVTLNAINPGLCSTELYRNVIFPLNWIFSAVFTVLARKPEMGSRTLVAAAMAGDGTHGLYLTDYAVEQVWPKYMKGEQGEALTERFWGELVECVEGIEPDVKAKI